ncbi:CPSF_A domain-containing protein, partial [Haematococcus lacustris]
MGLAALSPSTKGPQETFLAVGTAQGLRYLPTDCEAAYIRVYRVLDSGRRLELLHKTQTEGGPVGAVAGYKGRLLASSGPVLRLYELGKKKLLRKCEYKKLPVNIMSLQVQGSRIIVGDSQESVHLMKYKKAENIFYIFADDTMPRFVTSILPLDFDTFAVGDKFGNLTVLRLPADISAQVEEDPTGGKLAASTGKLNGAPHKLQAITNFHIGDTITAMQRAALQPGGQEVIVYGTVMGAIGVLYPFSSKEDADFFTHLEMHLRQEHPPLAGRDHMAFRSAYIPVKDCVDGDLCSQYPS